MKKTTSLFISLFMTVIIFGSYGLANPAVTSKCLSLSSANDQDGSFYIINVSAVKTEADARKKVLALQQSGYDAGYLWIPDYASLSGALYYSVYIGPFTTQYDCEVVTESYRKKHPEAYGLLVSQENKRVQISGIGKVKVTYNSNGGSGSKINEVKINYNETDGSGGYSQGMEDVLLNKERSEYNGCSTLSFNYLTINGRGDNLSVIIKSNSGKVLYQKIGIALSGVFSISKKTGLDELFFGSAIIIKNANGVLFKHSFESSGCN